MVFGQLREVQGLLECGGRCTVISSQQKRGATSDKRLYVLVLHAMLLRQANAAVCAAQRAAQIAEVQLHIGPVSLNVKLRKRVVGTLPALGGDGGCLRKTFGG